MELLAHILLHLRDTVLILRLHICPFLKFVKEEIMLVDPPFVEI